MFWERWDVWGRSPRRSASDQVPVHGLAVVHFGVILRAPYSCHCAAAGCLHALIYGHTPTLHSPIPVKDAVITTLRLEQHKFCSIGACHGLQNYNCKTHIPRAEKRGNMPCPAPNKDTHNKTTRKFQGGEGVHMCQEADAHRRVDVQDVLELLADADLRIPGAAVNKGRAETIQVT